MKHARGTRQFWALGNQRGPGQAKSWPPQADILGTLTKGDHHRGERQKESHTIRSVIHPFALNHSQPGLLKSSGRDTVPAVEQWPGASLSS